MTNMSINRELLISLLSTEGRKVFPTEGICIIVFGHNVAISPFLKKKTQVIRDKNEGFCPVGIAPKQMRHFCHGQPPDPDLAFLGHDACCP